ncbi:MAG: asparagine synthase (glutamine-hydrolyzing), partial [Candidatus Thorarchaeota archaeon]
MCGFVGIKNKTCADVDAALLSNMASTINHRGPDDEGFLIEGNIGFAHKRLSIIDLALGHQPMTRGEVTIVFNGEIYNYKELREDLKKANFQFRTHSDTEVLLAMYEAYGYDFIKKLNGMFAFLIYDRRKKQLIAGRDHFGIKPLYYANTKENIIFASEIKAILPHPSVHVEPNLDALNEYFTFQYVLGNGTLFKNIFKILPGQMLIIDLDTNEIKSIKYWEPSYKIDTFHTEEYFIHELRNLLENSVEIQLRSDVPVGTHLSGGLDSSIITSLAAKKYPSKLKTFTGAFREGKKYDESRYAQIVAESCGAEIFKIYPTVNDFIDLMPKLIYHLDEPVAGPGVFPQYLVSRLASKEVKVILGGQGGDEIFGGYARYIVAYFEQALKGAIFENNEEGGHIVSLQSIIPNLPYLKNYIPMIKEFTKMERFEPMDKRYFHLIDRKNGFHNLFTKEYQENYHRKILFGKFQKLFNHPDTQSYYNKMTHYDILN